MITASILLLSQYQSEFSIKQLRSQVIEKDLYDLIKLSESDAKCLDGSQAAFYFKQGNPQKFVIVLEGGGWCSNQTINDTLNDCYERSKTDLGSSNKYPQNYDFGGILSRNPIVNPQFFNHTSVYVKYCDGTGHQGYNKEPYTVKGNQIWFRGHNNTILTIETLIKVFGLGNAQQVILTGQSAGGLAVFYSIDWLTEKLTKLNPDIKVFGLPDSGIFLDYENAATKTHSYQIGAKNLLAVANKEVDPLAKDCVSAHQNEKWKCFFAEYLVFTIKTPLFFIQSEYDAASIYSVVGYTCAINGTLTGCNKQELANIGNYRKQTVSVIEGSLKRNPNWGAWGISCIDHVYSYYDKTFNNANYTVPANSKWTLSESIRQWFQSNITSHIDPNPWPSNGPCSHR